MTPVLALALSLALPDPAPAVRPLAERFAERVSLSGSASAPERALYDEALRLVLNTPTGRSLAEELLAKERRVEVSFTALENAYGMADPKDPALGRVLVSRDHLTWKPEWAPFVLAETLAHEVLGHLLHQRLAEEAGVGYEFNYCILDEMNAEVIGWTVIYEAGWHYPNGRAESMVADPPRYADELIWGSSSYSEALTRAELADPAGAYAARLGRLDARVSDPDFRARLRGMFEARSALLAAREDIRASFARAAKDPHFDRLEADLAARRERLRLLLDAVRLPAEDSAPRPLACAWRPGA